MKKHIYLTDNSQAIRERLKKDADIRVCVCCSFKGYGWLNYYLRENPDGTTSKEVHAVMGCDDEVADDERHDMFLYEARGMGEEIVECNDVETFINEINKC